MPHPTQTATSHLLGRSHIRLGWTFIKPSGHANHALRYGRGRSSTRRSRAIAELGLPIKVDTIIGAVENMAAANSYKLGDILTYNNGVSVEIHNTMLKVDSYWQIA